MFGRECRVEKRGTNKGWARVREHLGLRNVTGRERDVMEVRLAGRIRRIVRQRENGPL
jgi:hypothetical protein